MTKSSLTIPNINIDKFNVHTNEYILRPTINRPKALLLENDQKLATYIENINATTLQEPLIGNIDPFSTTGVIGFDLEKLARKYLGIPEKMPRNIVEMYDYNDAVIAEQDELLQFSNGEFLSRSLSEIHGTTHTIDNGTPPTGGETNMHSNVETDYTVDSTRLFNNQGLMYTVKGGVSGWYNTYLGGICEPCRKWIPVVKQTFDSKKTYKIDLQSFVPIQNHCLPNKYIKGLYAICIGSVIDNEDFERSIDIDIEYPDGTTQPLMKKSTTRIVNGGFKIAQIIPCDFAKNNNFDLTINSADTTVEIVAALCDIVPGVSPYVDKIEIVGNVSAGISGGITSADNALAGKNIWTSRLPTNTFSSWNNALSGLSAGLGQYFKTEITYNGIKTDSTSAINVFGKVVIDYDYMKIYGTMSCYVAGTDNFNTYIYTPEVYTSTDQIFKFINNYKIQDEDKKSKVVTTNTVRELWNQWHFSRPDLDGSNFTYWKKDADGVPTYDEWKTAFYATYNHNPSYTVPNRKLLKSEYRTVVVSGANTVPINVAVSNKKPAIKVYNSYIKTLPNMHLGSVIKNATATDFVNYSISNYKGNGLVITNSNLNLMKISYGFGKNVVDIVGLAGDALSLSGSITATSGVTGSNIAYESNWTYNGAKKICSAVMTAKQQTACCTVAFGAVNAYNVGTSLVDIKQLLNRKKKLYIKYYIDGVAYAVSSNTNDLQLYGQTMTAKEKTLELDSISIVDTVPTRIATPIDNINTYRKGKQWNKQDSIKIGAVIRKTVDNKYNLYILCSAFNRYYDGSGVKVGQVTGKIVIEQLKIV